MALCKILIRAGHRRYQLAAVTKDLKRAGLCFAADQIDDSVHVAHLFFKALGPVVDHGVCAEVAHGGNIARGYRCDGLQSRVTGQLNGIGSNIAGGSVNNHRLTSVELGVIKQCLPCRDGNDGNGGSFNVG